MGDRTYVELKILKDQYEEALALIEKHDGPPDEENENEEHIFFGFPEVNYGTLACLPFFREAGIAYDSHWQAGSDYTEGTEYGRFTPEGEFVRQEVYLRNEGVPLHSLLAAIDNHKELKRLILNHQETTCPLEWDNQIEYGKLYRTKQLITSKG